MKTTFKILLVFLAVVLGLGCSPRKGIAEKAQGNPSTVVGSLSVKGTSHFPMLLFTSESGGQFFIRGTGGLLRELSSLSGLKLKLTGAMDREEENRKGFIVTDYEIMPDKGFDAVAVGVIENGYINDADKGSPTTLKKVPEHFFEDNRGNLLWVMGKKTDDGSIEVVKWGVIRAGNND